MDKLIIVESPHKAKTIKHYLSQEYEVLSSYGHIRDLPENRYGIEYDGKFTPYYIIVPGREKVINTLINQAKKVKEIYLAADPDREGEAISWHLYEILKPFNENIKRITFNEITPRAIKEALLNSGDIDIDKVNARRLVAKRLGGQPEAVRKLFDDISLRYKDRNGGYTRMIKLGMRQGDAAEIVLLELVEE